MHPYQWEYLTDQSRRKVWIASRRIGKSFTLSLEAVLMAVMGKGPDNLIVSHDQDASNDLLDYCRIWLRWLSSMGVQAATIVGDKASRLTLAVGTRIVGIPGGRPEAIRHYGGNVFYDEASHQKRFRDNFQAGGPVIMQASGCIRIVTSAFSDVDLPWEIFGNDGGRYDGWARYRTTIVDAIEGGLKAKDGSELDLEELRMDLPDSDAWNAEYMGIPMSDAESYFPTDLLDICEKMPQLGETEGLAYGGFDVARSIRGDVAAMCEVKRKDTYYSASPVLFAERGQDFESMQNRAVRSFTDYNWKRMAVDAQGMGMETAERLQRRLGGPAVVEAVAMTSQSKADMMTTMRSLMDEKRLSLPKDRDLRLDLHSIKRIVGDSTVRYDAERNERGHADRAWALALAVRAAGKAPPPMNYGYQAVQHRGRGGWSGA